MLLPVDLRSVVQRLWERKEKEWTRPESPASYKCCFRLPSDVLFYSVGSTFSRDAYYVRNCTHEYPIVRWNEGGTLA